MKIPFLTMEAVWSFEPDCLLGYLTTSCSIVLNGEKQVIVCSSPQRKRIMESLLC